MSHWVRILNTNVPSPDQYHGFNAKHFHQNNFNIHKKYSRWNWSTTGLKVFDGCMWFACCVWRAVKIRDIMVEFPLMSLICVSCHVSPILYTNRYSHTRYISSCPLRAYMYRVGKIKPAWKYSWQLFVMYHYFIHFGIRGKDIAHNLHSRKYSEGFCRAPFSYCCIVALGGIILSIYPHNSGVFHWRLSDNNIITDWMKPGMPCSLCFQSYFILRILAIN